MQDLKIEKSSDQFKWIAVEHWNWVAPAFVKHKTAFDWEPGSIIFIATFIIWFAFFLQFFFVFSLKIHLHWTHAPDGDVVPVPADRQIPRSSLGFVSSQHIFAKSVPLDTFSRSSHQLTYFGKLDLIGLSYLSLAREVNEVPFSFVLVQRRVCYHCPACKELKWISTFLFHFSLFEKFITLTRSTFSPFCEDFIKCFDTAYTSLLKSITSLSCLMSFDHPFCCVTIHSLSAVIKQGKAKWMGGIAKLNGLNIFGRFGPNLSYIAPPMPKSNCPKNGHPKKFGLALKERGLRRNNNEEGAKTQWATNNALWPPPVKGTQSDHCISRGLDLS